ncbi:MAG: methyltransferase domain-containing protein [Phycisphaerales bacterium]|nr:methyltransferase domain-containing protein [Phycisphaerales bacterium]
MTPQPTFRDDDLANASHFDASARAHKHGHLAVDWGSASSQQLRFDVLIQLLGISSGMRVLDVGCGVGGLLDRLVEFGIDVQYHGIDISQEMIDICRSRHSSHTFTLGSVLEVDVPACDVAIASGIFNLRQTSPMDFLQAVASKMMQLSERGMGFNCLSSEADSKTPGEFHACPGEVLAFAHTLGRHVRYDHSYLPHDFTIAVLRAS